MIRYGMPFVLIVAALTMVFGFSIAMAGVDLGWWAP